MVAVVQKRSTILDRGAGFVGLRVVGRCAEDDVRSGRSDWVRSVCEKDIRVLLVEYE